MTIKYSEFTVFQKNLFFHGRLGYQWYPVFRKADYRFKNDKKSGKPLIFFDSALVISFTEDRLSLIAKSSMIFIQKNVGIT